ncbi:uncharacterized protein LOC100821211 isoform X2 [Brachypodium distachyon]|uniref:uncharacterized protein LOC100821211 isoform X2 n=1 Tax=Brachypodium distachyon TaxID=15368 RepID=UPI000D0D6707|nr:uncharacterized protein LOC100821211 isoform X2 [Brachypodium distachyon]XP_024316961.1 uncharacterized protein LOC100821211 isoform X2 [Brachypodium distachyon]|eukprot:XP_024316960.1 uncharacterized protein LOC100821211 isoform X2 [Brachypodium distachyon]
MSDERDGKAIHRRGTTPAALEDVNLLQEILQRLPPQPSSLPRAAQVSKLWEGLATDPAFLLRFRTRHQKAPVLGVFEKFGQDLVFTPTLDAPDRISPDRFSLNLGFDRHDSWDVLCCRHGRVLVINRTEAELLVYAPVSGELRSVPVPPDFTDDSYLYPQASGAVVCAAAEEGHVHGACHESPFKVVLVITDYGDLSQAAARVYSSETNMWGDTLSAGQRCRKMISRMPCTLVGNALYWWLLDSTDVMLEFDLEGQNLAVIKRPLLEGIHSGRVRIVRAEDGGVGLAVLSYPTFRLWGRKVSSSGVATWALQKTVNMHKIVGLPSWEKTGKEVIVGYSDDVHAIFISLECNVGTHVFMVNLDTMQSKDIDADLLENSYHPFTNFYPAGFTSIIPDWP